MSASRSLERDISIRRARIKPAHVAQVYRSLEFAMSFKAQVVATPTTEKVTGTLSGD